MPAKKNKKVLSAKKSQKKIVKKTLVKKVLVKKAPMKKVPVKKAPVKKITVKKLPLKKILVKKAPVKKAPVNKTPVKKASAKKIPAKKSSEKKILAKKIVPAKKVAKLTPAKINPVKLTPVKLTPVKANFAEPTPKKKEVKKKKGAKQEFIPKPVTKAEKNSLVKAILARGSTEKKPAPAKVEPETPAFRPYDSRKFEVAKKAIVIRRSEEGLKLNFKVGDYAIYPSHGVGKISGIEKTLINGQNFSCYLMTFERERLTIKIPAGSVKKIGLRHLVLKQEMDEVFVILRSGIKKLKGMWSRRAQEYETKINSGDIILLAEVIRDLTRDIEDSERSYSERIIYETAIYRLTSEYAAIYKIDFEEAKDKIVITAKDKLTGEQRSTQKDDFDDFDLDEKKPKGDDEDEEENEDEESEEDDDFGDDEDEDGPKKRKKKK
jgi:CarD family transcriptional regulator